MCEFLLIETENKIKMNLFKLDSKTDEITYIDEIISLFNAEGCELLLYATKSEIANVAGKGVSNVHIGNKPVTLIEEYPESLDHEGHYSESIWVEEATWNPTDEMLLNCMKSMESFCIFKTESVKVEYPECECGNKTYTHRHSNWIECTKCGKIQILRNTDVYRKYQVNDEARELMNQAIAAGMKVEIRPKGEDLQGGKILDGFFEMIGEALTGRKAIN